MEDSFAGYRFSFSTMSTNLDPSQSEHDAPSGLVGADRPESSEPVAATSHTQDTTDRSTLEDASPLLPQISPDTDFGLDLHSIISAGDPEMDKVNKRASNVQKLAQENEKLKEELRAMSQRLEAAERRRQELVRKKQAMKEPPSE
ncbi:uncharacterized protein C8R40DRAFT_905080 [Lentinula edodes]|uniref:uncharacterized protein n=1 Tax=Lentinula edodes TaxID=5353 RepID=UPI001E8CD574|nr:uncharacterized protein C8R40DRAFT_905080 [Lentinula edodes]KAH7877587.1 hypothetical protein C8R40DRAFT_905080 [Lentinula edodes]